MSTHTATTLPSISNLLNAHPPTPPLPDKLQTPAFNLLPASPVASHPPSPPHSLVHSPQYNHHHLHPFPVISPLLSPVDSCSSRSSFCKSPVSVPSLSPHPSAHLSVPGLDELPPLQGYDPPLRRLSSNTPQVAPWSVKDMHLASLSQSHPQPVQQQPSPPPPSSSTQQQQQLEQQKKQKQYQQQPATTADTPSTQIIISPSGQPILKRRRGRPPSNREPQQEGGWTFLTPTVWDVKQTTTTTISTTAALSGVSGSEEEGDDNRSCVSNNSRKSASENLHQCDMNGSMAAFTSSNMETVLQMPRKKRGRKPKRHIEGNSCFVWKDMPASRSPSKRTKKP